MIYFSLQVKQPGKAVCSLCQKTINYASRGVVAMTEHCQTKAHVEKVITKRTDYSLPTAAENTDAYGLHPMFASQLSTPKVSTSESNVPLCDRITQMESIVLGFVVENHLPFSTAEKIIELANEMMRDPHAAKKLKLARTTASYKLRYGLAKGFEDELMEKLRKTFFSFNLDEATSTTHHKVLTILVSYFCELRKEIIVEHLASVNIPIVNSETVCVAVVDFVKSKEIPWKNLLAMLMDSCGVMRGSRNGFETKIRLRVAPHLLDIDGDSCHYIHNASKIFTKVFDGYLESLFRDIYNDFKWSEDLKVELRAICDHLDVTYRQPEMYASTRWLSIYAIPVDTLYMFDALVVFYFPFLSPDHRKLYKSRLDAIYKRRQVSEITQKEIEKNQSYLKKKNLTKDGKERKERIYKKLFFTKRKTRLQVSLFTAALLTMKRYVKVSSRMNQQFTGFI